MEGAVTTAPRYLNFLGAAAEKAGPQWREP